MMRSLTWFLLCTLSLSSAWAQKKQAEPVVQQIADNTFLGFPSQLYFLVYIVGSLVTLVLFLYKTIYNKDSAKIEETAKVLGEAVKILTKLEEKVSNIEQKYVTEAEAKDIASKQISDLFAMMDRMKRSQ